MTRTETIRRTSTAKPVVEYLLTRIRGSDWGAEAWPSDAGASSIAISREDEETREPSLRAIGRAARLQ